MTSQRIAKLKLPDAPGVYFFRDARKRPIYIGRATSLKDRVRSYFGDDLIVTRGPRIVDMVTKAGSVTWIGTDSVLEAVLLESELIKRYQPFYNVDERDDKSSNYIVITDEDWPRVFLVRARDLEAGLRGHGRGVSAANGKSMYKIKERFGPYPESGLIKEALKILRKLFPFKDKKSHDPRHESFYRSLGRSPEGDDAKARLRYQDTIKYLTLFFRGKKSVIRKRLEKDMREYARRMEFEEAGRTRRLLYALDHINDMALIKRGRTSIYQGRTSLRIEAYDIAHLSGTNVVGAMVVSVNGQLATSEYRKFRISAQKNDDIAGLVEVLSRRLNHSEWAYPDMIVVDGNDNQLRAARAVLSARRVNIPVVAVTKDGRHKASKILGNSGIIGRHRNAIIAANAEAHRFVLRYHRSLREKSAVVKYQ